jgi:hypothetical protein
LHAAGFGTTGDAAGITRLPLRLLIFKGCWCRHPELNRGPADDEPDSSWFLCVEINRYWRGCHRPLIAERGREQLDVAKAQVNTW